jgi:tetratricopeptide (TPR) repeat protein
MTRPENPVPGNDPPPGDAPRFEIRAEDIEEITRKILRVIDRRDAEKQAGISRWKKGIDFLTKYWFLASVLIFIAACLLYGASILYPFKQISIADKELDRKQRQFEFEQTLAGHFLALGSDLMDIGKYRDAAKAYEEAVKLDGANIDARFGLHKAMLLDRSEEKQFDAEVIKRRIEIVLTSRPDDSHALSAKAQLYLETGDKAAAENNWRKALGKNPKLAHAHFGLATLALDKRQFNEAVESLEKAVALAPLNWEYRNNLASVLTYQENYAKALEHYQKAWSIDPDALLPLMEGARVLLLSGQLTNALMVLDRLISSLEDQRFCELEKNRGDWFISLRDGEVGLSGYPVKRAYAYRLRSVVHFLIKKPEQADLDFQKNPALSEKDVGQVNTLFKYDLYLLNEKQPAAAVRIKAFCENHPL